jgi:endonuclease/exonuclease/phosphatase family metal-dependent hydrolase
MYFQIGKIYYRLKSFFTRSNFYVKLMGLGTHQKQAHQPGLVMIQIDGLSKSQIKKALKNNKMPFFKSLLDKQNYKLYNHYPGLPSTTPSVQGELLYGVKQAVPAFGFYDSQRGRKTTMLDPYQAKKIESELTSQGKPLLEGGSAYCDIYSGGADETHFCVSDFSPEGLFRHRYPFGFLMLILMNIPAIVRTVALMAFEFLFALIDAFKGILTGKNFIEELQFIPSRVGSSVFLRELAVTGAKIDIARNLPAIHINFLGYDEQSHRRGPGSAFAHWSLKGIDDAIKRIYKAARRAPEREYDLWIYSDHGQEPTASYPSDFGKNVKAAIHEYLGKEVKAKKDNKKNRRDNVFPGWKNKKHRTSQNEENEIVSAMGPLGYIYLPSNIISNKEQIARELVNVANIPTTAIPFEDFKAIVFNKHGRFILPEQAHNVFDKQNPYFDEIVKDFLELCRHKYAGDIIFIGWDKNGTCYSFPDENGSHGGPGKQETDAFFAAPSDIILNDSKGYIRPIDIYNAAKKFRFSAKQKHAHKPDKNQNRLRIMTYNVHSCIGLDGKNSPERIARIIARTRPDVVALQELDHGKKRTSKQDQARLIAKALEMNYHYHPVLNVKSEKYGDAILSRFPIKSVKTYNLPKPARMKWLEQRGAIKITIKLGPKNITIINTHLGLTAPEKIIQVKYLAQNIVKNANENYIILCGDFNFSQSSSFHKDLSEFFSPQDKYPRLKNTKIKTWPCTYPIAAIDHFFYSKNIKLLEINSPKEDLVRIASDHIPLIADFDIQK